MKIKNVLPRIVKYSLPCALIVPNVLFSEGLPINTNLNTDAAAPVNVIINDTSYEVSPLTLLDHYGINSFNEVFDIQKKRIYNALLASSSKEVINFNNVLNKIINEKI